MKYIKLTILALLILLGMTFAIDCKANSKIIIGGGSLHFDSRSFKRLNQFNPSVGIEINDIQAVYIHKNSWNKKSLYMTYAPDYKINEYLTLTGQVGFATGYKCTNTIKYKGGTQNINYCSSVGVVPLGAVTIEYKPFRNEFSILTSIAPTVAMFAIGYDF